MVFLRRGAVPGIAVLVGFAFELSDIEQPLRGNLARALWAIALIWALVAFVTWEPVKRHISSSPGRPKPSKAGPAVAVPTVIEPKKTYLESQVRMNSEYDFIQRQLNKGNRIDKMAAGGARDEAGDEWVAMTYAGLLTFRPEWAAHFGNPELGAGFEDSFSRLGALSTWTELTDDEMLRKLFPKPVRRLVKGKDPDTLDDDDEPDDD